MIILNFQLFRNILFTPIFRNVKTFSMNVRHFFVVKISNSHIVNCCNFTSIAIDMQSSITTDVTAICKSSVSLIFRHCCLLVVYSNCYKFHNKSFRQLTYPCMDGFSKFYFATYVAGTRLFFEFCNLVEKELFFLKPIDNYIFL